MPIRRNVSIAPVREPELFRDRNAPSTRAGRSYSGYVYGDRNADVFTEGFIKIGSNKFEIKTEIFRDMENREFLLITFSDPRWVTLETVKIYRSGQKTFAGYITYPQWLTEEVDHPGNTYSFNYRGTRWQGGKDLAFAITERPRPQN